MAIAITEEELKKLMDEYGDIRYRLEDLKSSKENLLQQIISKYPEIKQEIDDMEEEISQKIEEAEKVEKKQKKILESYANAYAQSIILKEKGEVRSNLIRIGLERKVEYDSVGLDGMAMENPKLLAFRNESIKTRITLNAKQK